jgi:hypothetical protein
MKYITILFALFSIAVSNVCVAEIEGFKKIKFGMGKPELESLGFQCEKLSCSSIDLDREGYVREGVTIFERPVEGIVANLNADNLTYQIVVGVNARDFSTILEVMQNTFGKPKSVEKIDRGKNSKQSGFYRFRWLVGSTYLTAINGANRNLHAVVFEDPMLSPVMQALKPSKDF